MLEQDNKKTYLVAALVALLSIIIAFVYSNNYVPKPTKHLLSDKMVGLANNLQNLYPYILDEGRFYHPANQAAIRSGIHSLKQSFSKVEAHMMSSKHPGASISYKVLMHQLDVAEKSFLAGNLLYSKNLLNSISSTCSSCHQQDRKFGRNISQIKSNIFTSEFELAEFYYVTRNYTEALNLYDKYVLNNSVMENTNKIQISVQRQLNILLSIKRDIPAAIYLLQKYKSHAELPEFLHLEIEEWLKGLNAARRIFEPIKTRELTFLELQYLITAYFRNHETTPITFALTKSDEMFYYVLSGYINDYLGRAEKNEIPELLYWLAVCDRALNYHHNSSIANLYLKQCIIDNPKNPFAKRCYNEYKEYVKLSYAGSSGVRIPEDIQEELELLQKLINDDVAIPKNMDENL